MNSIKQKLASRKVWAALLGLVSSVLIVFGAGELTMNQVIGVISSFAVLVMYILSETISDAGHKTDPAATEPGDYKINWKKKLSSRKFWAALTTFVVSLFVALGLDDITTEQVVTLIGSVATMSMYILGEGIVDGKNVTGQDYGKMLDSMFEELDALENIDVSVPEATETKGDQPITETKEE